MVRSRKTSKGRRTSVSIPTPLSQKAQTFLCNVCEETFKHKAAFQRHKRIHENSGDLKKWKCSWQGCNHSTREKSNLNIHLKTHTGNKDLICTWSSGDGNCLFRCTDPSSFGRHRKGHVQRALIAKEPIQEDFRGLIERVTIPQRRTRGRQATAGSSSTGGGSQPSASEVILGVPELGYSSPSGSSTSSHNSADFDPLWNSEFILGNDLLPTSWIQDPATLTQGVSMAGYNSGSVNDASTDSPSFPDNYQHETSGGWHYDYTTNNSLSCNKIFDCYPFTYIQPRDQLDTPSTLPRSTFGPDNLGASSVPMMHMPAAQQMMSTVPQVSTHSEVENTWIHRLANDWIYPSSFSGAL